MECYVKESISFCFLKLSFRLWLQVLKFSWPKGGDRVVNQFGTAWINNLLYIPFFISGRLKFVFQFICMSSMGIWGIGTFWVQKKHTRKISYIHKDFELCQRFRHNFLYQNVLIFPFYILLTRKIHTFSSKGIDKFWSGVSAQFGPKKSYKENHQSIIF